MWPKAHERCFPRAGLGLFDQAALDIMGRMKRLFDVIIAAGCLAAAAPIMFVVALLVKWSSSGPVFYRGRRCGLKGVPFDMLKFRTMRQDAERVGGPSTSADDPRVTSIGRVLRRLKLDELPQLINVLRGEMSLVGPRPEVQAEVAEFQREYAVILSVKPGITDHASIKFRDEGEMLRGAKDPHRAYKTLIQPEKLRLGMEYARSNSFFGDLRILGATARAVLLG